MFCRNMSERHRKEAELYSRQTQELQAQVEPLKREASELQAHVDSHREEIRIVSTSTGVSKRVRSHCVSGHIRLALALDTKSARAGICPAHLHRHYYSLAVLQV